MKTENKIILTLYISMVFIIFALNLPLPQDDLMRDIVAGSYGYNYSNLYVYAPGLTNYNQYILFDIILHHLSLLTTRTITAHLTQLFCMIFFISPCIIILRRILKDSDDRYLFITILMMMILNNFTSLRYILSRPEMIFSCWVLWGLVLRNSKVGRVFWFGVGGLLIPFYWLSFFYVPIVYFVFQNKTSKIIFTLLYLIMIAVFWQYYSNFQWFHSILGLSHLIQNRLAVVGENKTILIIALSPITSMALIFYVYLHRKLLNHLITNFSENYSDYFMHIKSLITFREIYALIFTNSELQIITLLLIYFVSMNMIRYSAIISALFVFIVAYTLNNHNFKVHQLFRYAVLCCAIYLPMSIDCYKLIPQFTLPADSIVLGTSQSNYYVPFYSPNLKIAPTMEIGANLKDIQIMMQSIDVNGTISCNMLKKYHFQYLVERNLTHIPDCLKIYQIQKGWRCWSIN